MDDDVIVIYDEIEEEPEQFTAQNYEYMLAQALLTREAIQEKLRDPSENSNFQFIGSATHNNSTWNNFLAITYGGVEQNFFKCRDCTEIFDKDPQKSLGQLKNHNCKNAIKKGKQDDPELIKPLRTFAAAGKGQTKKPEKTKPLTREELLELYRNPKERPYLVAKQKTNFRCFAWQWLDLVFYKKQKQPFARCRFCEVLVPYSNKNGTSSIRKHALRCPAILAAKHNLGKQGIRPPNSELEHSNSSKLDTEEDTFSEDSSDDDRPLIQDVKMREKQMKPQIKPKIIKPQIIKPQIMKPNHFPLNQLKSRYNILKGKKIFNFRKIKTEDTKNSIWNFFETVYYKNVKQDCCKCTLCHTFLAEDENELSQHIQDHNNKSLNTKKVVSSKKEKIPETITEPKLKSYTSKRQSLPVVKVEPLADEEGDSYAETVTDATNFVTHNLVDCVITSAGQMLSLVDDINFRLLAQSLINLGAKHGERNANDFLPSVDSILKYTIPQRVRSLKTEIKELISNEPHLSISVDLTTHDKSNSSKSVTYLTVKVHAISQNFMSRAYVLGIHEFRDNAATSEEIKEEFLEIMKEYVNTHELHSRCFVVLNENNEALTKAFEEYTQLPSVTHCLESIVNKVLTVEDSELKILNVVVKIQELFEHITKEHNYALTKGDCLLDLLEEFYEMNKPIEKLLKYTRTCQRDHITLSDIPKNKVKTILNNFEVIKLCIDTIRQNQITINGILLWKKKLVEQYSPVLFEHQLNARLKLTTLELIQSTFLIDHSIYKIALFLNPNFKNLKFLSETERQEVFNALKELFLKRLRHCKPENMEDEADVIDKEINRYYITKSLDNSSEDLLEFWKRTTQFPNLKSIARYVLSIPGTSDGVQEEIFHKASRSIANGVGTSADFSSIIFLQSNYIEV